MPDISRRPRGDLTIGAVSKTTGCNIETIRYYERIGLVCHPPRSAGGHRVYDPDHVKELVFVLRCRELGFSIEEIRSLLRLAEGHEGTCAEVKVLALDHANNVQIKIAHLQKIERKLRNMASKCRGDTSPVPQCAIIETLFRVTA
jgi:MerR family mercuric resistance operon transcriptional regulator